MGRHGRSAYLSAPRSAQSARARYYRNKDVKDWLRSSAGKAERKRLALEHEAERQAGPCTIVYDGTGELPPNLLKAYPELAQQQKKPAK